jgi:glycosyltransferase involved in cell wall biosynthesis
MRVALVVFGPLADRSGGYRYDLHLKGALEAAGHTVVVVSQPDGVSYARHVSVARDVRWLDEVVAGTPDLVLVDELNHAAVGSVGMERLRRNLPEVPVVAVVHHLRVDEAPFRFRAWLRERRFLSRCDGWICNTSATLGRVRRVAGCRRSSAVVYPGADEGGASGERPAAAPENDGTCRIIFVGNVIPRKNLHRLVGAAAGLAGAVLDVYGDHHTEPSYTRSVATRARRLGVSVVFHGRVSDEELEGAYNGAHILAVPSLHEGFGIVYLEALKRGVPVVASVRGGAVEIVTTPESGRLVHPRRTGEIRKALQELCEMRVSSGVAAGPRERAGFFSDWATSMAGAVRFLEHLVS